MRSVRALVVTCFLLGMFFALGVGVASIAGSGGALVGLGLSSAVAFMVGRIYQEATVVDNVPDKERAAALVPVPRG